MQPAAARQPGVGDQHVDVAGLAQQRVDGVGIGEVGDDRPPADLRRQRLEHVRRRPVSVSEAPRAASAARDRLAEAARRARQQDPRTVELHANTATVAVKECRK